ncbi:predicted protein [Chaetomium globosum CBS 148.51]|uniref:Uncharacterized protein n=1 Tax=Chaetomium globosum (strain ATCC 6205 / CBS 148.51 / DSM 1962 / NBRC 6347 / NRRL 1970) TaxID=306901 RepID=Q2H0P5_CHAGB|nr:uncharacterized protein CHGG_04651 [Chaetomium globosum CBS 148.51]EAQ88032.1 predicted protein [Chaetomium globosum CBS 148.51]
MAGVFSGISAQQPAESNIGITHRAFVVLGRLLLSAVSFGDLLPDRCPGRPLKIPATQPQPGRGSPWHSATRRQPDPSLRF